MTKDEIRRVAEILEEEANCLKQSNVNSEGVWSGDFTVDKADHDEWKSLARKLRDHATTMRRPR